MKLILHIKSLLKLKSKEEFADFETWLKNRHGFSEFLYVTSEGLPILGNFKENIDEIAAEVPELVKALSVLETSKSYAIKTGDESIYVIIRISGDVLMLAKGSKIPRKSDVQEIIQKTRLEFKI